MLIASQQMKARRMHVVTNSTKGFLSGFLVVAGFATMDYNIAVALFAIVVGYLGIRSTLRGDINV